MEMRKKLIYVTAALLLTGILCTGCNVDQTINDAMDGVGSAVSSGEDSKKRTVYEDAKSAIKETIDTPSSAVFPTYGSSGISISSGSQSNSYTVTGYFDSDNLMGASVRHQYSVELIYSGNGVQYRVLALE